jgi:Tol biopolymer transport system component
LSFGAAVAALTLLTSTPTVDAATSSSGAPKLSKPITLPLKDSTAVLAPDGSRIAYSGDPKVCVRQIGGAKEVCGKDHGSLSGITWSPDSKFVTYTEYWDGDSDTDLFILDAKTGKERQLTDLPNGSAFHIDDHLIDRAPVFSADSKTIRFVRFDPSEKTSKYMEVLARGGKERDVPGGGGFAGSDLGDNPAVRYGEGWLFVDRKREANELLVYEFVSSKPKLVSTLGARIGEGHIVSASKQTQTVLVLSEPDPKATTPIVWPPVKVRIVNPSSGAVRFIKAKEGQQVTMARLSPDGKWLVAALQDPTSRIALELRSITADETLTTITGSATKALEMQWEKGKLMLNGRDGLTFYSAS